jgi:hypothetical protein
MYADSLFPVEVGEAGGGGGGGGVEERRRETLVRGRK